jgi:hypothetical protein
VRSAAPAPHPTIAFDSLPGHRPMRRLVLPPQALADAMATEVHPHAAHGGPGGRNSKHDHAVTRSRAASVRRRGGVARKAQPRAPCCTLTRRAHLGLIKVASLPCMHSTPPYRTLRRAADCTSPCTSRTRRPSVAPPSRTARRPSCPTLRAVIF